MRIPSLKQTTPLQKEWNALLKREQTLLARREQKKESALNRLLADKVPEKLQDTLNRAFEKAFLFIFEKGTGVIEKTYDKDALAKEHELNLAIDAARGSRKSLRAFSRNARRTGTNHLLLSGVSGAGMGVLGVGLPDIPVFTAMLLRCVYEIALHYGFDYNSEEEKYFILLVIEGAVSYGDHLTATNREIEVFSRAQKFSPERAQAPTPAYSPKSAPSCPLSINEQATQTGSVPNRPIQLKEQAAETGRALSKELLYMKFLQGIPLVGVVGGAYDAVCMKRISEYADIKYHKRFLQRQKDIRKGTL